MLYTNFNHKFTNLIKYIKQLRLPLFSLKRFYFTFFIVLIDTVYHEIH